MVEKQLETNNLREKIYLEMIIQGTTEKTAKVLVLGIIRDTID